MLRRAALAALLVACHGNGKSAATDDAAGGEAPPPPPPPPPCTGPPGPACGSTCGNGVVDEYCWTQPMPGHCYYQPIPTGEGCDTTTNQTCQSLGYYGGTVACTSCKIDASACTACTPGSMCTKLTIGSVMELAASGSSIAIAGSSGVAIVDGSSLSVSTTTSITSVTGIATLPGGWLVTARNPTRLVVVDAAGTAGLAHALPANATAPVLVAGPNGRVLVAWSEVGNNAWRAAFAIADASGDLVVPSTPLFGIQGGFVLVSATSDGTSFFVGAGGTLARIATDGTFTMTSGFPAQAANTGDRAFLSWSGTVGWYASAGPANSAQRFDASGALVGSARLLPNATMGDTVGVGDDLLVATRGHEVASDPFGIVVHRYPPTGNPQYVGALGASQTSDAQAIIYGADVIVAWDSGGAGTYLSRVTP